MISKAEKAEAEIVERAHAGEPYTVIAEAVGMSPTYVGRIAARNGVPRRRIVAVDEAMEARMVAMVEAGEHYPEVADRLGVHRSTVARTMTRLGVTPKMGARGSRNSRWKGGRSISSDGYIQVKRPGPPPAQKSGYVFEHLLVAERALGRPIPETADVHHVNERKDDNRPSNLVICQDQAYHQLLHQRQRALDECGHADWRKCWICGEYDHPERVVATSKNAHHPRCKRRWTRQHHDRGRNEYGGPI